VPQALQKCRSTRLDERNAAGVPRLQRSSSFFTRANAMIGPPDAFWHMRQWQTLTWWGAANSS
jgi:hypothetical protein